MSSDHEPGSDAPVAEDGRARAPGSAARPGRAGPRRTRRRGTSLEPEPRTEGPADAGARGAGGAAGASERDGSTPHPALRLLNVGYGNLVVVHRVVAIVHPQSSPMKRLRSEAGERGKLVDATQGRRTRSILVTDSDHLILSAIVPETLAARLAHEESGEPGT